MALFDKVTASNDCSGNIAHEPFFCIATTKVPFIITTQPDFYMHINDMLKNMIVLGVQGELTIRSAVVKVAVEAIHLLLVSHFFCFM